MSQNITSRQAAQFNAKIRGNPALAKVNQRAVVKAASDGLNKTERAYRDLLELHRRAGEIQGYQSHSITLHIGKDCRYTPDFWTWDGDVCTFIEVKGFLRDDALVKFRAAQRQFPMFKFIMVRRVKGRFEIIRD